MKNAGWSFMTKKMDSQTAQRQVCRIKLQETPWARGASRQLDMSTDPDGRPWFSHEALVSHQSAPRGTEKPVRDLILWLLQAGMQTLSPEVVESKPDGVVCLSQGRRETPTEQLEKLPCCAAALAAAAAAADAGGAEDGARDDAAPADAAQACESPIGSANVVQPSALFNDDDRVGNGKDTVNPRPRAPVRQTSTSTPQVRSPDVSGRIDFDNCEFGPESDADDF